MIHGNFVRRQLGRTRKQAFVFTLCVILSMVTLVTLGGFSRSVDESLQKDARELHAGDIIIHSHSEFSPALMEAVSSLEREGRAQKARTYTFYSVVRTSGGDKSLLSSIKVAEPGYPFYGAVGLASGRPFADVLTRGGLVVERSLLDRLGLAVGDTLLVGKAALTIRDIVESEPDRPVNLFSLGPRVFVAAADLEALELVGTGSRVHHDLLLKVREARETDRLAAALREKALPDRERVETFRTARSGIKRFFDNFLFFLSLTGVFTLLLAGIGIQSSLSAYLREREKTIAVMKALGARSRFIIGHYLIVVLILGLGGTLLGLAASLLLQYYLPVLFKGILPGKVGVVISPAAIMEGLVLGICIVALFTFLPLYSLKNVRPLSIFRKQRLYWKRGLPWYLATLTISLFFTAMIMWRIRDVRTGAWFVLGVLSLVAATALMTETVLFFLRRAKVGALPVRQALKGLFRPGNATRPIIITLAAALAAIFAIYLIEENLDAAFIRSYPPESPNVFFLDIQTAQREEFEKELSLPAELYPVVNALVLSVNGEPVDREEERRQRRDNLAREFHLTYRDSLIADEEMLEGKTLFRDDWEGPQVSVLDEVLEMRKMAVGDTITFRIQGVPLTARISSLRTRTRSSIQPFFYFVFPESVIGNAPQTIFAAARVEKENIAPLQNRIVGKFPNISVIDVTQTVAVFSRVLKKLSGIIRFFTSFSIVAGILIIISSILATRYARIQEAVYYKILGAEGGFVLRVFTLENLLLGLISAALALLISQAGSWIITSRVFDIPYSFMPVQSILMMSAMVLLIVTVGLSASRSILRKKPVVFLREQSEE
jgi:putative ABC transport system permease protein